MKKIHCYKTEDVKAQVVGYMPKMTDDEGRVLANQITAATGPNRVYVHVFNHEKKCTTFQTSAYLDNQGLAVTIAAFRTAGLVGIHFWRKTIISEKQMAEAL